MNLKRYVVTYDADVRDPETRRAKLISNVQIARGSILTTVTELVALYETSGFTGLIERMKERAAS